MFRALFGAGGGLLLSVFAIVFVLMPVRGNCQETETIARWVALQMGVHKAYGLPAVNFVDKETLREVFKAGSDGLMARWSADLGDENARSMMQLYLDTAVGLFNPDTQTIYVGRFLQDCRRNAVLAHEIAHYFQHVVRGAIPKGGFAGEMLLIEREMEAAIIEQRYVREQCGTELVSAQIR